MSLTALFGDSTTIANGVLSITLSEVHMKAQTFVESLGASGVYVGVTTENQNDPEVLAIAFMQAFCNYFTAERLANDSTADVSCSLSNRLVTGPPFGEEATGAATLSDEYTLVHSGISLNFPMPDPNNAFS